jgi:GDPmannose 4,6-dehydratase
VSGDVALIVGVTGQVGAYLARFLLGKGYRVHGTSRDAALARVEGLAALGIRDDVPLHSLSPSDPSSVRDVLERVAPAEMYNLTGQSSVGLSFSQPLETLSGIVSGTVNLLEALHRVAPNVRFYSAGSSECFGETGRHPANELTAFRPKSPYGIAKAASISLVTNYRESYGLFACSGILFNHESPLRPTRFVTRKITSAASRIAQGSRERLALGNLAVYRDWGWVPDYVEAMWAILQCDTADDFIIASGVSHSLEDFVATAFAARMTSHIQRASQRRRDASSAGAPKPHLPRSCRAWCAPNGWGQRRYRSLMVGRSPAERATQHERAANARVTCGCCHDCIIHTHPRTPRVRDAPPDDPFPPPL